MVNRILLFLFISAFWNVSRAQTTDPTKNSQSFEGIRLEKKDQFFSIPLGEKVVIKTEAKKHKGVLDSVSAGRIYIDGVGIQTLDIETIKFSSARKRKNGKLLLISAPVSFAGAVGFAYWYFGSGGEWTNFMTYPLLFYTPVGIIVGLIVLKKKKFKLKKGWDVVQP